MSHKNEALKRSKRGSEYYLGGIGFGGHKVYDKASGAYQHYFKNKGHASGGLKYKNTDLEFASSYRNPTATEKSTRRHIVKKSKPMLEK